MEKIKYVLCINFILEDESICSQQKNCDETSNENEEASKDGSCGCSESRINLENGKTSLNPEEVLYIKWRNRK